MNSALTASFRVARISSDLIRFNPKQSFEHLQAVHQPSPVYIFKNIKTSFTLGVKNDLRHSSGLILLLTRSTFSTISRRGSNFLILPQFTLLER